MASPGGWSSSGISFSDQNTLRFLRGGNANLEELPFATLAPEDRLATIEASEDHQILVLESRGSLSVGINAPEDFVKAVCSSWKIPASFLRKILGPGSLCRLDYHLETSRSPTKGEVLQGINVGFRWGEGHSNYILVFGRFDIPSSKFRLLLSSRDIQDFPISNYQMLDFVSLPGAGGEHPLDLIGLLLQCCERYIDVSSQRTNIEILQVGKSLESLYSPDMAKWATDWHIPSNNGSQRKIDSLFSCYNDATWGEKCCHELMEICRRYKWLADHLEKQHGFALPRTLVDDASHRVQTHAYLYRYLENIVTTQFSFQYNHFTQRDAEATIQISESSKEIAEVAQRDGASMKTVAYLTLIFLPATFICAVFSTNIFHLENFRGGKVIDEVVSPGWWVFALCIISATVMTFGVWLLLANKQRRGIRIQRKMQRALNKITLSPVEGDGSNDSV